jgi:DNA polymerase/3'-5' exonuclease PolX
VVDNVDNNDRPTMVKEISHVHFTALTQLQLGGNKIESAEGLIRVHMAHIKCLFLCTDNDKIGGQQHHFSGSDEEGCMA